MNTQPQKRTPDRSAPLASQPDDTAVIQGADEDRLREVLTFHKLAFT